MASIKTSNSNTSSQTEYRVYSDKSQDSELVSKILDLFIRAYIESELDEQQTQRNNSCPQSSNKEDESNEEYNIT